MKCETSGGLRVYVKRVRDNNFEYTVAIPARRSSAGGVGQDTLSRFCFSKKSAMRPKSVDPIVGARCLLFCPHTHKTCL